MSTSHLSLPRTWTLFIYSANWFCHGQYFYILSIHLLNFPLRIFGVNGVYRLLDFYTLTPGHYFYTLSQSVVYLTIKNICFRSVYNIYNGLFLQVNVRYLNSFISLTLVLIELWIKQIISRERRRSEGTSRIHYLVLINCQIVDKLECNCINVFYDA